MKHPRLKQVSSLVMAVIMTLAMVMPANTMTAMAAQGSKQITILGTSDLHGRIYPWDYASDKEDAAAGYAKVATVVKEVKAKNPNTIVVDAGDTIQDNSIELFQKDAKNPMIEAMNTIGYDSWTLGNHEFNFGLDLLGKVMKQSNATVLAANIYKEDGKRFATPYKIVEKDGVKVALIGMIAPYVPRWEASTPDHFKGLKFTDPVQETKKVIAELKGKADVFVGVMHIGKEAEYGADGVADIAKANPELAAVICGHAHSDIAGELINGVLVVEPASAGKKVSQIDLSLEKQADKWVVSDKKAQNIDVAKYEADKGMLDKFKYVHEKSQANANIVVGKVAQDFIKQPEILPGLPRMQVEDTALIDLINKVQMIYAKTDLSSAAAFRSDMNLLKGDFKKKDAVNVYKYDNTLIGAKITGKQLKVYMEWSAKYFNQAKAGDLTVSFNPDVRLYNYDMFAGVNYSIDISKPAGQRICDLTFKGKPVTDDMSFTIAMNNYRFGGLVSDGILSADSKIYDSYTLMGDNGRIRDLIGEYMAKAGDVKPECDNNWKLVGYNFDNPVKDLVYDMVKAGAIKLPTSEDGRTPNVKSLNVNDPEIKALSNVKKLDVLAINDFHGSLKEEGKNVGGAKLVNEIKTAKAANPNSIFVASGDLFQGSAPSNLLEGKPVADMLKEAGLVVSAIGNHEYDWGTDNLPTWEKEGNFEFLASNIYNVAENKLVSYAKPYKIVEIDGVKVAIIGFTTPDTATQTKAENIKGVVFKQPEEVLPQTIKEVKEQGADAVVVLAHSGAMQDKKTKAITGEIEAIAKVAGIDAIIAGHSHQFINGKVNNVPVMMSVNNGRALGKLSMLVDKDTKKLVKVFTGVDVLYERPTTLKEDEKTKTMLDAAMKDLAPILSEKVGETTVDISHEEKEGTLMGEWSAQIMKDAVKADVGIQNGGGLRCSVAKGDITMETMYTLMPFDNTVYTIKLTGKQLKAAVENGLYNDTRRFGQIAGAYVTYDMSKTFGNRIVTITLENGDKIVDDKEYLVATNDFMAGGGDGYTVFLEGKEGTNTNIPIRDTMIEAIKKAKTITPVYKGYQKNVADEKGAKVTELPVKTESLPKAA